MATRTLVISRKLGTRTATLVIAVLAAAAAVVAAQLPAYASTCTTSDAQGSCGPYDYSQITSSDGSNTYVNNDVWSPVSGWSEALTATNPGNWSVVANMPAGNNSVVSYPDVQELYNNVPLSSYSSLTSAFTEAMNPHSGTLSEAAYDLWLNNWNYEVMIWNDNYGEDLSDDTDLGSVTIGGQKFEVYRNGPPGSGEELIVSLDSNEQSGTIDILSTLNWLAGKGYLPSGATLTSIDYGWEILSTGGQPETYQLSSFCIDENGATKCGTGGSSSSPPSSPPSSSPPTQTPSSSPPSSPATQPPSSPATQPASSPATQPPSSPATQTPSSSPPTQPPSSLATQTAPTQTPLWYWMVTRTSIGAGALLPAPQQHQNELPQGRHHHRRSGLGVGFPS
jgi:Glycosyl hydrolase family 12